MTDAMDVSQGLVANQILCPENECGSRLSVQADDVSAHCASQHLSYYPHSCSLCLKTGNGFPTYDKLIEHMLEAHPEADDVETEMEQDLGKDNKLLIMVTKFMSYANSSKHSPIKKKRRSPIRSVASPIPEEGTEERENLFGAQDIRISVVKKSGKITAYFKPIQHSSPHTPTHSVDDLKKFTQFTAKFSSTPRRTPNGKPERRKCSQNLLLNEDLFDISNVSDDEEKHHKSLTFSATTTTMRLQDRNASLQSLSTPDQCRTCEICGKIFRSDYHCKRHQSQVHTPAQGKIQCEICPFPMYFSHAVPYSKHRNEFHR